jgi:signal transduction histidine kinase/AraC-like DNA-binding protein/ABC-type sugar transport system substrate-binding protein
MTQREKHHTIGVLPGYQLFEGNTISDYLQSVLNGIIAASHDKNCHLLMACGIDTPRTRGHYTPAWPILMPDTTFVPVGPWNTDGLIVIPPLVSEPRSQYLQELRASGFPVVFCGPGENGPSVVTDNAAGIFQAVEHLKQHDHQNIAFIAGLEGISGDSSIRLEAFHAAAKAFHLVGFERMIAYGQHTIEGGEIAMRQLLASGEMFTAVVASNLRSAIGAMRSARSAGLRVPEELAFIGIDDRLNAEAQDPPVTTVHLQTFQLGYQSVGLLMDCIHGKRQASETVLVPSQLVIRQSCGCHSGHKKRFNIENGELFDHPDSIIAAMVDAVTEKSYQLDRKILLDWLNEVVHGLDESFSSGNSDVFSIEMEHLLQKVKNCYEDPYVFQEALTILGDYLDKLTDQTENQDDFKPYYRILDDARLSLVDQSRRYAAGRLLEQEMLADHLGNMTASLLNTLDESEIVINLRHHLPGLGLQDVHVAIFEQDVEDPTAWSVLAKFSESQGRVVQERISTWMFPASMLEGENNNSLLSLTLLPLITQDAQIGYIAFQTEQLALCGAIARQVAAAYMTCKLYQQANDGRRLAEEANRMKSRFLSTVSHELRTPLNVIVGLSEFMAREYREGRPMTIEDIERINASSQHLGFLIRDVLDLASNEAGQLRLALQPADVVDVLRPALETGEQLVKQKGLKWSLHLPSQPVHILCDPTRIRQVIINLISNAVKFTSQGWVALKAVVSQTEVILTVSDTGIGIPASEQALIFDEFRQSDRTASRGYGGLGLGLAISKHLIELHGGRIEVQSIGVEGEGTTFSITLPLIHESPDEALPEIDAGQAVLLLTAEHTDSESIVAHLQAQGFSVVVQQIEGANEWRKPTDKGDINSPAAILIDSHLVMNAGWQILKNLRDDAQIAGVPILLYSLTSEGHEGALLELELGSKPLSGPLLEQMLSRSMDVQRPPQTVLIVDDNPDILDLHSRIVRQALPGCRINTASNGRLAIQSLEQIRPDLVLLDLMMPELDGFGVLEAMRANETTRTIPVIVLTARALNETDMQRLSHGVISVLEKGVFSAAETLAHISSAIARTGRAGTAAQRLVRRAIAYIHENYAETLTREQMATHLAVSENYLTNCFQKEMGISPLTFLNRFRIKEACKLLEEGNQTITAVALAVGFNDLTYFARVFHREMGVSPSEYRRGVRKSAPSSHLL